MAPDTPEIPVPDGWEGKIVPRKETDAPIFTGSYDDTPDPPEKESDEAI